MVMTMMSRVARVAGRTSTGGDIVHHLVIMMTVVLVMVMTVEIVMIVMILDIEEIVGHVTTVTSFQVHVDNQR